MGENSGFNDLEYIDNSVFTKLVYIIATTDIVIMYTVTTYKIYYLILLLEFKTDAIDKNSSCSRVYEEVEILT